MLFDGFMVSCSGSNMNGIFRTTFGSVFAEEVGGFAIIP